MHDVILIVYKRCARFTGKRWHTMHQAFCNFILSLWPCISQATKKKKRKNRALGLLFGIASEQMNNSKDKKGHMEKGETYDNEKVTLCKRNYKEIAARNTQIYSEDGKNQQN